MSTIHIEQKHNLGLNEAKGKVEEIASQLKQRLGANYHWSGNELIFERSGANGTILVDPKSYIVDINLGLMMLPFKGEIERQIKGFLTRA